MKPFAILFLILSVTGISPAQVPVIEGAQVTIPYDELKRLLEAADRAEEAEEEPVPPMESVLSAARYQLDFTGDTPALSADFEARTLTDAWHAIPLCGGAVQLTTTETSESASVIFSKNLYTILANGIGEHQLSLDFSVAGLAEWNRNEGLVFQPAPATVSELLVTGLDDNRTIEIEGLTSSPTDSGDLRFHLPSDGRQLQLRLRESAADTPVIPSDWSLHSQIIVRFIDGRLQHAARIQAQAESGSGLSMTLILPPKAGRLSVESDDLEHFELLPRTDEGRPVRIDWKTRDTLDRTLLVSWEIPQSPLAETWEIIPPRAETPQDADAAAIESRSLIALATVEGLELSHPSFRSAIESRQLPEWLQEQLGSEEILTADITGADPISLAASWLPRLDTAQATVSQANFDTRLVPDGSILVTADYTIQHSAPIEWQIDLPAADQILTCEVNHESFKPVQRGETGIEFRLPNPTPDSFDNEEAFRGSKVHLCYSLKLDPLDPVSGRVAIELPQTDLFIHKLDWSLAIPDRYEPTAIEGNVELSNAPAGDGKPNNQIRLTKELCRDERPAVEVFYQRKDLNTDT